MIRTEERDIPARKIQWVGVGLIVFLLLIGIALLTFQNHLVKNFDQAGNWPRLTPRLQAEFESGRIREQQQVEQLRHLQTYQGLNESGPWVQVPIDRAMEFLLEVKSTEPGKLFPQHSHGGAK